MRGPRAVLRAVVLAGGLLAAAAALPATRPSAAQAEETFVATSVLAAKHLVRADAARLLRPLWEEPLTGSGVRVAVVDTGIDPTHPDLAGAVVLWKDFVGDAGGVRREAPYDDHGHGTHVAALLAGRGHFQPSPLDHAFPAGVRGMAPGAVLLVAKAMGANGRGGDDAVADAIRWALDPNGDGDLSDGADVINLSVGIDKAEPGSRALDFVGTQTRRAVNLALLRGVVVVVSSGNDGARKVAEPGDVGGVLTVGAVDRDGRPVAFTNTGDGLDLLAPGILLSAYPRALDGEDGRADGYVALAGTSMAAPLVAGAIALLLEARPGLVEKGTDRDRTGDVLVVERLLKDHARPVAPLGDRAYGAGLLDVAASLAAVGVPAGRVSESAVAALVAAGALVVGAAAAVATRPRGRRGEDAGEVAFEIVGR